MYDPLSTVESVKRWLSTTVDTDDAVIGDLIKTCSELIGRFCGRDNLGDVLTYNETYWGPRGGPQTSQPRLTLNHYPIVSITSCVIGSNTVPVITNPGATTNQSGIYVETVPEPRQLIFLYMNWPMSWPWAGLPLQISYTAGYASNATPPGLRQACNQWVGEIMKSRGWIGYKSKTLQGETVSFEDGKDWAMSPRTKAMLQPYRNRIPIMGFP